MENKVIVKEKNITDVVLNQVNALQKSNAIQFPENYSYANALKSAWLVLQDVVDKKGEKALKVCTPTSIANALLDMVVQALSPAKKQCYFVVYGKNLTLMRSYMGTLAVAKRVTDLKDIKANVIRVKDSFEFHVDPQTGYTVLDRHEIPFDGLDEDIIGAYAIKIFDDGHTDMEIMTWKQIISAWRQGAAKGNSPAHQNFPEEMAKKTVINRACKKEIYSSDDSDILIAAINRTTEAEYIDYDMEESPLLKEPQPKEKNEVKNKTQAKDEKEGNEQKPPELF